MKIGIVTEYYYPSLGGITEHVHHFSHEVKKLGHRPVIITGNAGDDPSVNLKDVEIIKVGRSLPIYSNGSVARITVGFYLSRKIKEILESEKFDIVHIHSPFIPVLPTLAQYYANTITIGTFHTYFSSSGSLRIFSHWVKKYFEGLNGRIAVSKLCVESISRYFKGDYKIIPNGVDIVKFNSDCEKVKEFDDGKLNIFFLSRLEPRNGLEYLIKAFSMIRKKRNDCRLIIGGNGPLKVYFKSMVPNEIKPDVHFLGRINSARPNYYATADIFCFPTTKASFGITIMEAMASAKPVAAFSMPAYEAMIKSGEDGVLCGKASAENLAMALTRLLDSEGERIRIGTNARIRAEEFSWTKITKQIVNYYDEVKRNF